uniref:C2H2-type domain-containing protein n=1 Tax=Heterorhabditis bacteriophora TaxID=37862 RepID=A0A1I7XDS8_HETBA
MDEMNACTECGFTTSSIQVFTSHIGTQDIANLGNQGAYVQHHEEEHNRSSSGELSHTPVSITCIIT